MSIDFNFFIMLLFTTPCAVVLSVCTGVGGCVVGHEKMSSCPAFCVGLRRVGCIAVASKYHAACLICDDGIGMCGGVAEKMMDQLVGVLHWIRLLQRQHRFTHLV